MSQPPVPPYSLTFTSALSDDYILTADVLVDLESTSPVGVFQNASGLSEALFVRADGVLCQLSPAPGTSAAGWTAAAVGTTSGVTQAVAGTHSDGTIHGFYTDASSLYHISYDGTTWSKPDTLPLVSSLSITNNFITGELIAYGVDANGALQVVRDIAGTWTANAIPFSSALTGLQPMLMFTSDADDWTMAVSGGAVSGGELQLYTGSGTAVASGPAKVPTPNPVQQILTGFWMNNTALFLFTDDKNNLYTNVGTAASLVQVPGAVVVQGSALVDLENQIHLYTVDANGTISVLHQTGWNNSTGPVWAPVIPFDTDFVLLFTGTNPMQSTSFFAVHSGGALWSYVLDTTAQTWTSARAQMPSSTTYHVPTYRTQITVVDANGNPAPNLAVTVTADSLSAVVVQGAFLPVGPSQPATITTNAGGSVTLTTIATGASSPQLTFTATSLTAAPAVNPAAGVQTYLSGQGTLNAGTTNQLAQFSSTTLQQATVDGQPLAPGAGNSAMASAAASGISTMFQVSAGGGSPAPRVAATNGISGFVLDFTDPGNPTFTPLGSAEDFQRARAAAVITGDVGSWWSSIESFFADVWNGIRSAAIIVQKWVVNAIDGTVDMIVKIGEEIQNVVGLVIRGIEDVVSVVQSIFAAIGAEVEKVVDWLKMLFDWQAIVDTKNALESAISQAFPWLANEITTKGKPLVDGFFGKLEKQVTDAFDAMITQAAGQSLSTLAGSPSSSSFSPNMMRFGAMSPALSTVSQGQVSSVSTVQNNWLLEKIESYFGGGPTITTVQALVTPLESLNTAFGKVSADFLSALTAFGAFFTNALSDPKQLGTIGVADLLTAAKDVALAVLAFLDGIIDALMDVASAAVDAVGNLLTTPFTIPIISGIVDDIAGRLGIDIPATSILSIFCFGLAIPVTVVYKVINGVQNEPFPGGTLPTSGSLAAFDDPNQSAADAIKMTAVVIAALWAVMDTILDCAPTNLMFFQVIDIMAPTLLNVMTWPGGGFPFSAIPLCTGEDQASFANWIAGWVVVALDVALLVAGGISWAPESTIARYLDPVGKILMSGFGAINLIGGIVASSLGAGGGAIAGNILGPLPALTQFLRLDSLVTASDGVTWAIKLVIDFFAGEGVAIALVAE